MSNHSAMILFIVTVFLAVGAIGVYTAINQDTGAQGTGMTVSADTLEITHVSIHGIEDRKAHYATIEIQGSGTYDLERAYVSITTPSGSAQLPIESQG
jgi:hypothetical protein